MGDKLHGRLSPPSPPPSAVAAAQGRRRPTARRRQRGGCSADGGGFWRKKTVCWSCGGEVDDGSGKWGMYNKNKCVVDCFKTYFLPMGIARSLYFFAREFARGSRQNRSLTKKSGQICPRAKKYDSHKEIVNPFSASPDLRNLCRDRGHVTPLSVRWPLERQRPEAIITNDQDNTKNTLAILCGRERPVGYI